VQWILHSSVTLKVIVCLSARRAVAILKDLSMWKVRVAKLFPKNGSVEEQTKQLSTTAFGIAVGTPHRFLSLCQASRDPKKGYPSLLDKVNLIVLDSEVSNKQYTVCTLPDTAPQCMELLTNFAIPQMMEREDLHLAFF
jgi:U3-containing 90S pre-ribosomal complex subunit